MAWPQISAFLLLSMLSAKTVCTYIGGWLAYHLGGLRHRSNQQRNGTPFPKHQHRLQVILCGFPRTGTLSLMVGLGRLGFPCFHGAHLVNPGAANLYLKAFRSANPKDWEKLLHGYASIADFPATCAYKQLMRIFPDAKVILNIRDPNKWYDSFYQTVVRTTEGHDHTIFKILTPWAAKCTKLTLYKYHFDNKAEDRETCMKALLQHVEEVKGEVPPDKLLIYDIEKEDGWSKLCAFLNVPTPQTSFPKLNNRNEHRSHMNKVARTYTVVLLLYVALVASILIYLV